MTSNNEFVKLEEKVDFSVVINIIKSLSELKYNNYVLLEKLNFDLESYKKDGNGIDPRNINDFKIEYPDDIIFTEGHELFSTLTKEKEIIEEFIRKLKGLVIFYYDIEKNDLKYHFLELKSIIQQLLLCTIINPFDDNACYVSEFLLNNKVDDVIQIINNCSLKNVIWK
jgi:hypothetical protein